MKDSYFHAPNVEIRIQTVQVLEDIKIQFMKA